MWGIRNLLNLIAVAPPRPSARKLITSSTVPPRSSDSLGAVEYDLVAFVLIGTLQVPLQSFALTFCATSMPRRRPILTPHRGL